MPEIIFKNGIILNLERPGINMSYGISNLVQPNCNKSGS